MPDEKILSVLVEMYQQVVIALMWFVTCHSGQVQTTLELLFFLIT